MPKIVTARGSDATPRIKQARLSGPSRSLDRRITVWRDDLADAALADFVTAPRYATGVYMRSILPAAMLCRTPDDDAVAVSALLLGEIFIVFDLIAGWAWGQCLHDGYVGWIRSAGLVPNGSAFSSHVIAAPSATLFFAPDIKSKAVATLPMNARIAAIPTDDHFLATTDGFVHRRHLRPVIEMGNDPAGMALGFVGTPYVWGGRTRDGIDCSGLVQAVLRACGLFCPRDSDQQADAFAFIDSAERRRGDLVVFPGHVGILADVDTLIHATAHWMITVVEPLAAAIERLPATGFRRPPITAVTPCSSE